METRTLQLRVTGMSCEHCVAAVERALLRTRGVISAVVNLKDARATVQYDGAVATPEAMIDAVTEAGYEASVLELSEAR